MKPYIVPKGQRLMVVNGQTVQVSKSRRKGSGMSKKAKAAAATARRKIKIPVVQGSLISFGVIDAIKRGNMASGANNKLSDFQNRLVLNYSGWHEASGKWLPSKAKGLIGLGLWGATSMTGIYKRANQLLGRYKIPVFRL